MQAVCVNRLIRDIPPVTRVFVMTTVALFIIGATKIVPIFHFVNYWPFTIGKLQLWRPCKYRLFLFETSISSPPRCLRPPESASRIFWISILLLFYVKWLLWLFNVLWLVEVRFLGTRPKTPGPTSRSFEYQVYCWFKWMAPMGS